MGEKLGPQRWNHLYKITLKHWFLFSQTLYSKNLDFYCTCPSWTALNLGLLSGSSLVSLITTSRWGIRAVLYIKKESVAIFPMPCFHHVTVPPFHFLTLLATFLDFLQPNFLLLPTSILPFHWVHHSLTHTILLASCALYSPYCYGN